MAVKIRLKQTGKRNARTFRVVAIDESKKRDGSVIEYLGHIDSFQKPPQAQLNRERIQHWLKVGAKMSPAVEKYFTGQ